MRDSRCLSFLDSNVELFCRHGHQSVIPFHHLVWNGDHLEPEQENGKDDSGLEVGEDIAGTLASTGSSKWTELQTSLGVVCVTCKSIWIEPVAR